MNWIVLYGVMANMKLFSFYFDAHTLSYYESAEGPPRGVENRNLLSHPDDLRLEAYLIRMT